MARRRRKDLLVADETLDGIMFGMALASKPGVMQRRDAFWASVRQDTEAMVHIPKDRLIATLKQMNPAYIVELLERNTPVELRHRIAHSMRGKNRSEWLVALGIPEPREELKS